MTKEEFTKNVLEAEKSMYCTAKAFLHNDSDCADAVQSVILTAFQKLHTLKSPEYFRTWLIRILINECKSMLRKRKYSESIEDIADPGQHFEDECGSEVYKAVNSLDEKYRIVFVLFYCEGFSVEEISGMLNISLSAVKTRLFRARNILREKLKGEFYEED